MYRRPWKLLGVAVLLLITGAAAWYLGTRLPDVDPVAQAERLVRESLETALAADLAWDEIALSFAPASITLQGVRASWGGESGSRARATRIVLVPSLGADGAAFESVHIEELRVELAGEDTFASLAGVAGGHRLSFALRELDLSRGPPTDGGASGAALLCRGEFETGGVFNVEVWGLEMDGFAVPPGDRSGKPRATQINATFERVPARDWAPFVPQLHNAGGSISGELEIEIAPAQPGSQAARPIEGRFEIDATRAELSIAGAYRKPVGDPATLTGHFARDRRGDFELLEAQLTIRKAGVGDTRP